MPDNLPFISIVVPTYARPKQLVACLAALADLDYPHERREVIVVDDGGPDLLEPLVAPFRSQMELGLITQPNAGPGLARNAGAARARGEFLAFTDDDCAPAAGWLRALAARLAAAPGRAVGGRTINSLDANPYAVASQIIIDVVYDYFNADPERARFLTSINLALPVRPFREIGGFYGEGSEDRDLCDRWLQHGLGMAYAAEAVVYHAHDTDLQSFLRLHYVYGLGAYHYHRARAGRNRGRTKFDPFSAMLLLRYPLRRQHPRRTFGLGMLLAASKAANAAGFLVEAARALAGQVRANV